MPPVVIGNSSIVLPHSQKPAAQNLQANVAQMTNSLLNFMQRQKAVAAPAAHLIVNFKLLHNSQFLKHSEGCGDHGVIVQGEVIEMKLIDSQLVAQGDLSSLEGGRQAVSEPVPEKDGVHQFLNL